MKRLISIILVAVMLLSSTAVISIAAEGVTTASASSVKGDVNNDSKVTAKDVLLVRKYLSGSLDGAFFNKGNGDVTGDGKITTLDALRLRQYLGGAIDSVDSTPAVNEKPVVSINGVSLSDYVITMPQALVASPEGPNPDPETINNSFHFGVRKFRGYLSTVTDICPSNIITEESAATSVYSHFIHCVENNVDYGDEGFNIRIDESGDVWLSASSKRAGMLYAGMTFIEDYFGHRWLGIDDTGEALRYQEKGVNVDLKPGLNVTETPGFEYRASLGTALKSTENGAMQRKMNTREQQAGVDNVKFGWGFGRSGPHNAHSIGPYTGAYELSDNPCLSVTTTAGAQIFEKVKNSIDDVITKYVINGGYNFSKDFTQISCSMNDTLLCCTCETCKAGYKNEGGFNGVYLSFVNQVALYIQQKYDRVCNNNQDYLSVFCILYDHSLPKTVVPVENVIVCYCGNGCNNHSINSNECQVAGQIVDFLKENNKLTNKYGPGNPDLEDHYITYFDGKNQTDAVQIKKFTELAEQQRLRSENGKSFKVYFWYYPTNYHYYAVSSPMLDVIRKDIRYLAEVGVDGVYSEGQTALYDDTNFSYGFEKLKEYLIAELLWDPYMSDAEYELFMDHYLETVYGDAWSYIKEYAMMAEEAANLNTCWINNTDAPWEMVNRKYYRENYAKIVELFDNALAAVGNNGTYQRRIKEVRVLADFLGVSASHGTSQWNTELVRTGYDRLFKYISSTTEPDGYYMTHIRTWKDENNVVHEDHCNYMLSKEHPVNISYGYNNNIDPMRWYTDFLEWATPGAKRAVNFN